MTNLQQRIADYKRLGCVVEMVPAPKDAVTFDKMMVVWVDEKKQTIYHVNKWNTKKDDFVE
jgi:hypothetical protein